ncbi:heme/hemin ABC transporter substrate-binding protein [Chelativorans salis]|uniref:ABC transporter substrate-binding protein n=1 Tax=Chelativorans salis TaxID=2978478 RepID=A0ABT2LL23_9HYPH|nr:ABC transporter substrate-binding protein [Chelativorans sp. EGI FJ00035]MCT7375296.1 ABC transporter substrate-binding protein [Chelativorans sp. EGI FJ00035]
MLANLKPLRLLGALMAAAFLAAPAHAAEDLPQPFEDASRLVSIGGSLTEIVYALGEEEHLVARDSTGTFPPEAQDLPDVGYMRALSPEGVLSVTPSAILALEGSGPPETMDVLTKASVPLVVVPETFDRQGILRKIRFVGAALGETVKAEELADTVARDIDAAERLTDGVTEPKRVLFILSMQGGRIMASGKDTAADGIIAMAGGVNAIREFSGYKQVSEEAVAEAQPDVILMMDRGGDHGAADEELFSHPAIAPTPAARDKAIVRMDGGYLLGFGPRTAGAVRDLAAALYGQLAAN